jgi:hypothetical protein
LDLVSKRRTVASKTSQEHAAAVAVLVLADPNDREITLGVGGDSGPLLIAN